MIIHTSNNGKAPRETRSTTAVDPQHLKVKEDISLTKNDCITISIQKISSTHKFILKILGFRELTSPGHFRPGPSKNH